MTCPAAQADLAAVVLAITEQLDASANPALAGLPEVILRAFKVQEEAGELAQAVIGALGQNPRKGTTHTWDDAATEAIDVALAALVFLASIRPDTFTNLLHHRIDHIHARLHHHRPEHSMPSRLL